MFVTSLFPWFWIQTFFPFLWPVAKEANMYHNSTSLRNQLCWPLFLFYCSYWGLFSGRVDSLMSLWFLNLRCLFSISVAIWSLKNTICLTIFSKSTIRFFHFVFVFFLCRFLLLKLLALRPPVFDLSLFSFFHSGCLTKWLLENIERIHLCSCTWYLKNIIWYVFMNKLNRYFFTSLIIKIVAKAFWTTI